MEPASCPAQKLIAHSDGLRLRSLPSLSGSVLTVIPFNKQVTVYRTPIIQSEGYYWQRVDDGNLQGWCANSASNLPSFQDLPCS
jgi:hypothetical protein